MPHNPLHAVSALPEASRLRSSAPSALPEASHFRLRFFWGPPHKRICFMGRSQNFRILKMGVLQGGPIRLPNGPPSGSDLRSDLGSSWGPRSGSAWSPRGSPSGPQKSASCSGSETRPKPYIYNGLSDFRTLAETLKFQVLGWPDLVSRGPPKVSEKGVPIS